jgi:hypothetical protein
MWWVLWIALLAFSELEWLVEARYPPFRFMLQGDWFFATLAEKPSQGRVYWAFGHHRLLSCSLVIHLSLFLVGLHIPVPRNTDKSNSSSSSPMRLNSSD